MQHQDRADAAEKRLHDAMDAAEIQRLKTGADQSLSHAMTPVSGLICALLIVSGAQRRTCDIRHPVPAKFRLARDERKETRRSEPLTPSNYRITLWRIGSLPERRIKTACPAPIARHVRNSPARPEGETYQLLVDD
jgi:hypothetical protein